MDGLTGAYLTLKCAKGLGPRKAKLLVEALGGALGVLDATPNALLKVESIGPALVKAIQEAKKSTWPKLEWDRAQRLGVTLVHLEHEHYPASLRAVYDPPVLLYVRGKLPALPGDLPKAVGIVGTRDASDYALGLTQTLAKDLAAAGVVVVSGLALGVDSAAHRGATLAQEGQTIAVLGSGVDVIYPRHNQGLAKTIWEGRGAVISEYALGTSPRASNFPGRNRIINGLSTGIIVVEAGQRSGALITADYAAQEGRTVFAIPGRVGDPRSSGTLGLLKHGAVLVQDVDDVLSELGWQGGATERAPRLDLDPEERHLVDTIAKLGTPLLDDLLDSERDAARLLPLLMRLELKGAIKTLPGGRYSYLKG